ncbi:hypothetical protein [Aureimonas sp. AU20]|uniref:hypothetical protein n=1 Tax=Aureimonas sp. AU20 TaxID=1349819 RepID=UPI0012E36287|nr:hypothetical protein [Aureimonas sp. AU20]
MAAFDISEPTEQRGTTNMIRSILKALFVGWVTKKIAERSARRSATPQPAGAPYPDRRA